MGVDNFLTTSNNVGLDPFIVDGKTMKSKNRYFNKRIAELRSQLTRNQYSSKRIIRLCYKRTNYFQDKMHKIAFNIVSYCVKNDIGTIIVGKNNGWKQEVNLGKQTNQKFCFIPHSVFVKKLKEKAIIAGILVIEQEESYTSKASFLDNDFIPTYGKEKEVPKFSGKRIKRGLYKTSEGIFINADVNGASNIIKKNDPNAFDSIKDFSYLYKRVERIAI